MGKTVTYADFDLISVSTDGKKLKAVFFDKQNPNTKWPPECNDAPHPDLMEALKDLTGSEVMATTLCLLDGWNHCRDHIKANDEALATARRRFNEEILRCDVLELKFTGEGETEGIQIKGKLDCEGAKVKLETPQFVFIEADEELRERAKSWAESVKKEVWSYLFKNKKSQQSLGLDEPSEGEEGSTGLSVVA